MRRCDDRPPLLEDPFAQTLSGKYTICSKHINEAGLLQQRIAALFCGPSAFGSCAVSFNVPLSFSKSFTCFQLLFLSLTILTIIFCYPFFSQDVCICCCFVRCGTRPFSLACDVTASESKARLRCHISLQEGLFTSLRDKTARTHGNGSRFR